MSSATIDLQVPHPESLYIDPHLDVAFAEIISDFLPQSELRETIFGKIALDAAEIEGDQEIVLKANREIGALALENIVEVESVCESSHPMSLDRAIYLAAEGNSEALAMVRMNAKTDFLERAYKYGVILPRVRITKDGEGKLIQYGQLLSDMHSNSLRYLTSPVLKERTKAEVINGERLQYYSDQGLLKDNVIVTFSLVTSDFSEAEAEEARFFTDTMSASIQLVSEDDEGIYLDAAFVAGRESSLEKRFDESAVRKLVNDLGLDFSNYSADEMLAHPLIIPKKHVSEMLQVVKMYDQKAHQLTGKSKLFGRDTSGGTHDYEGHVREYHLKMEAMNADIEDTVQQLLAAKEHIVSPVQATKLLDAINDIKLKKRIVGDLSIDASVLGREAAYYVNHARYLQAQHGVHFDMLILQQRIETVGRSSSCPSGASDNSFVDSLSRPFGDVIDTENSEKEQELEDCDFVSLECPKCHDKFVPTKCRNGVYIGECGCRSDEK